MNILYVIIGIALIVVGVWLVIKEVKIFIKGKQDTYGTEIKGLGTGIMCIMLGVALIIHFI